MSRAPRRPSPSVPPTVRPTPRTGTTRTSPTRSGCAARAARLLGCVLLAGCAADRPPSEPAPEPAPPTPPPSGPAPDAAAVPTPAEVAARLAAGDPRGAEALLRRRLAQAPPTPVDHFQLGLALHGQGRYAEARVAHAQAAGTPRFAGPGAYNAACACARLGLADDAFAWLTKAVAAGWGDRRALREDPDLEALRGDPRLAGVLPALRTGADAFVEPVRVLHELHGEAGGDQFGWVARVVGDLDGDGVLDFAATAPTHAGGGPGAGAVQVFSGRDAKLLFRVDGRPGQGLGSSVAGEADVDGDGVPDVVIGAPANGGGPGSARVVSGADGSLLHELTAGEAGDRFGQKVCLLPDLDGDGRAEVAVGAMGADANGVDSGAVHVFAGVDGRHLYRVQGEAAGDAFGSSMDAIRSGGPPLLAVGAQGGGPRRNGRVHVFELTASGVRPRFVIDTDEAGANLGQYFVSFLGDVDGDGVSDVYASDWNHSGAGKGAGRVFVHSGASGERLLTVDGREPGEGLGTSAAVCGDVDGDGAADLALGAWQCGRGAPSGGAVYLVSGRTGEELRRLTATQAGDTLGFDAVGLGDVDGDGVVDLLLTSAWSLVEQGRQGRVWVVAGEPPAR